MRFAFLLGWRFFLSSKGGGTSRNLPKIAFTIAVLGVTIPVTVLSIQNGYMRAIVERLSSLTYHVTIDTRKIENSDQLIDEVQKTTLTDSLYYRGIANGYNHLRKEYPEGKEISDTELSDSGTHSYIDIVVPYHQANVLISTPEGVYQAGVQGVPQELFNYNPIVKNFRIVAPKNGNFTLSDDSEVLLGAGLARRLGIRDEDLEASLSDNWSPPIVRFTVDRQVGLESESMPYTERFQVVGLFSSGYRDIDENTAIVLLSASLKLTNRTKPSHIGIMLNNVLLQHVAKGPIRDAFGRVYESEKGDMVAYWKQKSIKSVSDELANLIIALDWEKFQLKIVTIIMILIAFLTIGLTLFVVVTDKTKQIAILMAMGSRRSQVLMVFIVQGMLISGFGTLLGLLLGGLLVPSSLTYLLDATTAVKEAWTAILSFIGLGDNLSNFTIGQSTVFQPDTIPFELLTEDVVILLTSSIVIGGFFSLLPALRASEIHPVKVIRNG